MEVTCILRSVDTKVLAALEAQGGTFEGAEPDASSAGELGASSAGELGASSVAGPAALSAAARDALPAVTSADGPSGFAAWRTKAVHAASAAHVVP